MTRTTTRQLSPETRRRVMASIYKKDTVPELTFRTALWAAGIRGWRCHAKLPGTPDVVFTRWRLAIFIDGVWWHGHPDYLPRGRRGPYWDAKIAGNIARDRDVDRALRALGWTVMRVWDLDVLKRTSAVVSDVRAVLDRLMISPPPSPSRAAVAGRRRIKVISV